MEHLDGLRAEMDDREKQKGDIEEEIAEITKQLDELKKEYPDMFKEQNAQAEVFLEKAGSSDWRDDEVEIISNDEESFELINVSKRERLGEKLIEAKVAASELAFKFVEMTEDNSTLHDRGRIKADIAAQKQIAEKTNEEITALDSTEVHWDWNSYRTENSTGWLLGAVALMKPKDLYGQRIKFTELLEKLQQEFKIDIDEKSQAMVGESKQKLQEKLAELNFKKDNI